MDRRTFIATGAAIPLATLPAAASTVDPLTAMFDDWIAARREWGRLSDAYEDWDTPRMLSLSDKQETLFRQMITTKAVTYEGLLRQITLLWEDCGPVHIGKSSYESNDVELRLKCQILLGAERLAGVPTWQPVNPQMVPPSEF